MKITRVQYDGEGQWLDVRFDNGRAFRARAEFLGVVFEATIHAARAMSGSRRIDCRVLKTDVEELPT